MRRSGLLAAAVLTVVLIATGAYAATSADSTPSSQIVLATEALQSAATEGRDQCVGGAGECGGADISCELHALGLLSPNDTGGVVSAGGWIDQCTDRAAELGIRVCLEYKYFGGTSFTTFDCNPDTGYKVRSDVWSIQGDPTGTVCYHGSQWRAHSFGRLKSYGGTTYYDNVFTITMDC